MLQQLSVHKSCQAQDNAEIAELKSLHFPLGAGVGYLVNICLMVAVSHILAAFDG